MSIGEEIESLRWLLKDATERLAALEAMATVPDAIMLPAWRRPTIAQALEAASAVIGCSPDAFRKRSLTAHRSELSRLNRIVTLALVREWTDASPGEIAKALGYKDGKAISEFVRAGHRQLGTRVAKSIRDEFAARFVRSS